MGMINWHDQMKRLDELKGSLRAADGDIINITHIKTISETDEPITKPDGQVVMVLRFKYVFNNGDIKLIPQTLHEKIGHLIMEMPQLKTIKVRKTGEGLNTRYDALPLL